MIKNFIAALQFLTILTVRKNATMEEGDLAKSMPYFPLIGFLIGVVLVYADKVFSLIALPYSVATFLVVILSVLITRALHIDGLADTSDGLMGGRDPSSRLAIMKDSRLGTAGAISIVFVLFMKYVCLSNLFESDRIAALLIAPLAARWAQTLMVFNANYGREQGLGKAFVGQLKTGGLAAASAATVGLSAFVIVRLDAHSVMLFLLLVCGVVGLTILGKHYLVRKLGGVTGDAIGAMSELIEVFVLLLFVMFSSGS